MLFFEIFDFDLYPTLLFLNLHNGCQFKMLVDIVGIDFYGYNQLNFSRFCLVYNLLSFQNNLRVIVKIFENNFFYSVMEIFPSANWLEREIWDLFGIYFIFHKDLRRILNDYGFLGYPLRKDFPLSGFFEVNYSETLKRVIYVSVQLSQKYRVFNFWNVWLEK